MVTSRTTWYAEDNSPHETKTEALRHDLRLLLTPLVDSDAIARKVVEKIGFDEAGSLSDCLFQLRDEIAKYAD